MLLRLKNGTILANGYGSGPFKTAGRSSPQTVPLRLAIEPLLQVDVPRVVVRVIEHPSPLVKTGEMHRTAQLRPGR